MFITENKFSSSSSSNSLNRL